MDPQATWEQMLDALIASEHDLAVTLADGLLRWLDHGGFPPRIAQAGAAPLAELNRKLAYAGARHIRRVASAASRRKNR